MPDALIMRAKLQKEYVAGYNIFSNTIEILKACSDSEHFDEISPADLLTLTNEQIAELLIPTETLKTKIKAAQHQKTIEEVN